MNYEPIADLVIAKYGIKPTLDLIDFARTDKFLAQFGCKTVVDIFKVAQAINAKTGI